MAAFLTALLLSLTLRCSIGETECVVDESNACQAKCGETTLDISNLMKYP